MRKAVLVGLLMASTFAARADATTYTYVTQPFGDCSGYDCIVAPGTVLTYTLEIDETRLPRRIMLNALVLLRIKQLSHIPVEMESRAEISSFVGSVVELSTGTVWSSSIVPVNHFLSSTVYEGYLTLSTDRYGSVTTWAGNNYEGGPNDPFWYGNTEKTGYDGFSSGQVSIGQGNWTGRSIYAPPAPVPLPASLLLLTVALGALGILRQRRIA